MSYNQYGVNILCIPSKKEIEQRRRMSKLQTDYWTVLYKKKKKKRFFHFKFSCSLQSIICRFFVMCEIG